MTLKEIWNNRSWRFTFWLTSALLAYRTCPETGAAPALSAATGALYLLMWVLLIHLDARVGERFSPLMGFQLVMMALAAVTRLAGTGGVLTTIALFWLVPVGMPLQGLVRLVNDGASRSDGGMAVASLLVLAVLLALRLAMGAAFCRNRK